MAGTSTIELRETLARNKQKPGSVHRLAIAKTAAMLRQWEFCQKVAQAYLTKGGASADKTKQCQDLITTAKDEITLGHSYVNDKEYQTEMFQPP